MQVVLIEMSVCSPIAIVYIGSCYVVNMIHATDTWVFMLAHFGCYCRVGE
jgi:hypothetical protein